MVGREVVWRFISPILCHDGIHQGGGSCEGHVIRAVDLFRYSACLGSIGNLKDIENLGRSLLVSSVREKKLFVFSLIEGGGGGGAVGSNHMMLIQLLVTGMYM
jgi:hypothetical protein